MSDQNPTCPNTSEGTCPSCAEGTPCQNESAVKAVVTDTRPANVSESVVAKIAQLKVAKLPELVNSVSLSGSDAKRLIEEACLKDDATLVGLEVAGLRIIAVYQLVDGDEQVATNVSYWSQLADEVQSVKSAIRYFRENNKDARPTDIELSVDTCDAMRAASKQDWVSLAGEEVGSAMVELLEKKGATGLIHTRFCGCVIRSVGQHETFVSSNPLGKLRGHEVNGASSVEVFVIDPPGAGGACHHYLVLTPKSEGGFPPGSPVRKPIPNTAMDLLEYPDGSLVLQHTRGWIMLEGGPGSQLVKFQQGNLATEGINGGTHEAFLDIIIHRLDCFQNGANPSPFNQGAMTCLIGGLDMLQIRTKERLARGVEGQSKA